MNSDITCIVASQKTASADLTSFGDQLEKCSLLPSEVVIISTNHSVCSVHTIIIQV